MGFRTEEINALKSAIITAKFTGNGTGTPALVKGRELTLARTGVGVYTLTIGSTTTARRKGTLCYAAATATLASSIPLHGLVALSSGVFTITFLNASGVATDPGVSAVIHFVAVLEG
jgi:hypothetical protein